MIEIFLGLFSQGKRLGAKKEFKLSIARKVVA